MRISIVLVLLGAASRVFAFEPAMHVAVMDPLCSKLSCACVKGFAQRDYSALGDFLSKELGRPVEIVPSETLEEANKQTGNQIDLVVGKSSVIVWQAAQLDLTLKPLAMMTDQNGKTTLTGLFIVRSGDPAKKVADLKGRKVLFGPPDCDEKYAAPLAMMKTLGMPIPTEPETSPACNHAAVDVTKNLADAAVISSYAIKLAEGCGAIEKGSLKIIGETAPVPFIMVFATPRLSKKDALAVKAALMKVQDEAAIKVKLESRDGFIPTPK